MTTRLPPPDPATGPPVPDRAARDNAPGGPGLSPSPERPGGKTSRPPPVPGPPRAAAGILSPVTGAARLDRVAAPARGRSPQAPAGGAAAELAPSAGSAGRTYTIALPPGLKLLSLNDRLHWSGRARRTEALKKAAWAMALKGKIPRLERVLVAAVYQPPPDWRERDSDNPVASVKAAIDGIVAAKVLPGDECPRYVTGVYCTIGEPYPGGRLVLHLMPADPLRPLTVKRAGEVP